MKPKIEKSIYIGICAFSGFLIGFSADKINTILGIVLFALGVFMFVMSSLKISEL